jgi:hypothetical protein
MIGPAALLWSFVLLFAAPFWASKTPQQWSDQELQELLTDSPWAQLVPGPGLAAPGPPVQVYVATAGPMQQAEQELKRRAEARRNPGTEPPPEDPLAGEYRAWLQANSATQIVLAVQVERPDALSDEAEVRTMEKESVMRVGHRKIKMSGHFPPYAGDPYLRLAFPRPTDLDPAKVKKISFDLYLPGVTEPYRSAEFKLKDMVVAGKLEL